MIDLRLGDWRDVLADVECDALVTDPPYGARTHNGHSYDGQSDSAERREISYDHLTPNDVRGFVSHWSPRTRGWIAVLSCHDLLPVWLKAMADAGRYAFAPVPCVISGMTVRLVGDGPACWAVYLAVSRPRTREYATWGSLPGAYYGRRVGGQHIGGKPEWLMRAIIRDYTRPGDLVCDPCAGYGTTLQAAVGLGRRAVGAEIDPDTHAKAVQRLERGQMEMTL